MSGAEIAYANVNSSRPGHGEAAHSATCGPEASDRWSIPEPAGRAIACGSRHPPCWVCCPFSQGEALLTTRRWVAACLTAVGLLTCSPAAKADPTLDLENLPGTQLEQMLQTGQVT